MFLPGDRFCLFWQGFRFLLRPEFCSLLILGVNRIRKRLLCLFFTAFIAGWVSPGLCLAQTAFTVGVVRSFPNRQVLLPLDFSAVEDAVAMQMDLVYDGVTLVSEPVLQGSATQNHIVSSEIVGGDRQRVVIFSRDNSVIGSGLILEIPIVVSPVAQEGRFSVNVTNLIVSSADAKRIEPGDVVAGEVTVVSPPTVASAGVDETGAVEFRFGGVDGDMYRVEASVDLVNWTVLTTITISAGMAEFSDADSLIVDRKFYRLVLLDPE